MLVIKNLSKQLNEKIIVHNVSFSVSEGEIAVFLGASGVGKSTLLRILNNLESIDKGSIELDGKMLDLTLVNQKHTVGMVFQHFNLFDHLSVESNITLPLTTTTNATPSDANRVAHDLLKHYHLFEKKDLYISQLSGGQKQRLAIARTVALKPRIICLDEPTSALDPMLTNYVAQHIQELAKQGYIILVATHDVAILEKLNCTIYLMQDGSFLEKARSSEFFANRTAYPQLNAFIQGEERL